MHLFLHCFLALFFLLCELTIGIRSVRSDKERSRRDKVEVASMNQCYFDRNPSHMYQLPGGTSICRYSGHYYTIGETWFEVNKCLQCTCIAPTAIGCCKITLKPVVMPKRCMADTWSRKSEVPPLTTCMAPIVNMNDHRRPCRNWSLRRKFQNARFQSVNGYRGRFLQTVSRRKTNSKRNANATV
uniref:uncharacterized protein LOC104266017 n=1 Tax=Ciona intestinalis TaxID=7719 RepID=UPI000521C55C|nr:uncharacterized protein LOC104266017 [Ciona intestinalis]|eukprot:XP_009859628.1 uncharacterized protein LOC104266017 [Ciona intestinalis]